MKKIISIFSILFFTNIHAVTYTMDDFEFFTEACKRGQLSSCSHLAVIYEEDLLVKQDMNKAKKLYSKACGGGEPFACHNMAVIYSKSDNPHVKKISLVLYENACRAGYPNSCEYMGKYYRDSQSLDSNNAKAREMYQLGCDLNSRFACKEVRILDASTDNYDGYTH